MHIPADILFLENDYQVTFFINIDIIDVVDTSSRTQ